jgi:phosphoserine phosphatase RsbU/P
MSLPPHNAERLSEPSPSILVVDDTSANLQVLTGMLKERGYKVRPAPSGKLALLAAQRDPPDLILLDINMPEMNGYEVCRQLKADDRLRGIPVIFISALTEQLDKVNAFAIGGVDYITKPFQMEELHARVETHLKLHRLQTELRAANSDLAAANDRMSRDLQAAMRIQQTFLPLEAATIPGIEFAWIYRPCDELAGDGLNVVTLDDQHVGLYVLDVSGHGVAAALLSVTISRLLSSSADHSSILVRRGTGQASITAPAEVAAHLNRLFPFDGVTSQFVTLLYGVLELTTGDFRYVSAGHPAPIHVHVAGTSSVLESDGFPIGVAEEGYRERSVRLEPGDRLYLYSDGVFEALNTTGEQFGGSRLERSIDASRNSPIRESVQAILTHVECWQGTKAMGDDLSLLAVERHLVPVVEPTAKSGASGDAQSCAASDGEDCAPGAFEVNQHSKSLTRAARSVRTDVLR